MLAAARLALDLRIPTEQAGSAMLAIPDRDANQGWKLYEDAVAGFYRVALSGCGWRVRAQSPIDWPREDSTPTLPDIMPGMIRDIVLERGSRRIIIDTKFTEIVSRGQHGNLSLNSGNIYQIYAYLRSQENAADPPSLHSDGVLLYPSPGR